MTAPSRTRVAVLGTLCSLDLLLTELLLRQGIDAVTLRPASAGGLTEGDAQLFPSVTPRQVRTYRSGLHLLAQLRRFGFVFTYSAQLGFDAGRLRRGYPLFQRLGWPRYAALCSGSDILERAIEPGPAGRIQRMTMRGAAVNVVPNYPLAVDNAVRLRLPSVAILPLMQSAQTPAELRALPRGGPSFRRDDDDLLLLHASHLDWGERDAKPGRVSTKGNDRFFRALAAFAERSDRKVRVIVLDRGADREPARRLVEALGLDGVVTWHEALTRDRLFDAIRDVDVVVDQFDVGGLGMTSWEALALGTPVLMHLDERLDRLVHGEPTPVLRAHSVEEITAQLERAADPAELERVRSQVAEWTERHHAAAYLPEYLLYAALATGDLTLTR
jgi:hypothetical protein